MREHSEIDRMGFIGYYNHHHVDVFDIAEDPV